MERSSCCLDFKNLLNDRHRILRYWTSWELSFRSTYESEWFIIRQSENPFGQAGACVGGHSDASPALSPRPCVGHCHTTLC